MIVGWGVKRSSGLCQSEEGSEMGEVGGTHNKGETRVKREGEGSIGQRHAVFGGAREGRALETRGGRCGFFWKEWSLVAFSQSKAEAMQRLYRRWEIDRD